MICGIRIEVNDSNAAAYLRYESVISTCFYPERNRATNEILENTYFCVDRGMNITIKPGGVISIRGSLHKFRYGKNTHTNFSHYDVGETIAKLCTRYGIDSQKCRIKSLEFGVNFVPKISVKNMLSCLRGFDNKLLSEPIDKSRKIYNAKCTMLDRYIVKYYDKGLLLGLPELNMMRFEYKTRRMADIQKLGIGTLYDLTDKEKYLLLCIKLCDTSKKVTLFDEQIKIDELSDPRLRDMFHKGSNPYYWTHWDKPRKKRAIAKKEYKATVSRIAHRDILNDMLDAIAYKTILLAHT